MTSEQNELRTNVRRMTCRRCISNLDSNIKKDSSITAEVLSFCTLTKLNNKYMKAK